MPKGIYKRIKKWKRDNHHQNNPRWKGDLAGYSSVHGWLRRNFGYPQKCEHCGKVGSRPKRKWTIEWALKRGCLYKHDRNNFMQLCNSCHKKYDFSETMRSMFSRIHSGKILPKTVIESIRKRMMGNKFRLGKKHSEETKQKQREAMLKINNVKNTFFRT